MKGRGRECSKRRGQRLETEVKNYSLQTGLRPLPSALAQLFDLRREKLKGDVLGLSSGAAQEFDHSERAVGVARVDDDLRGCESRGVLGEPARDGVACALVVELFGV